MKYTGLRGIGGRTARYAVAGTLLLAGGSVTGCQPATRVPDASTQPQTLQNVRAAFERVRPDLVIGSVVDILPNDPFAEVADYNRPHTPRRGEVFTLIDETQRPIAHGVVRDVTDDGAAAVEFDVLEGARRPRIGDLAFLFPDERPSAGR